MQEVGLDKDIGEDVDEQLVEASDSDYDPNEGDQVQYTPDVQKMHFDQTVHALFNIKAYNLTPPPFD